MTNNTKQGLIVIVIFLGLGFLAGIPIAIHQGRLYSRTELTDIRGSMQQSYLDTIGSRTDVLNQQSIVLKTADLWGMFCDTNRGLLKFTGILPPEAIFLSKAPIDVGSRTLLCAANGRVSIYGIDATGNFRKISKEELDNWPHVSAKDFATNR